MNQPARTRVLKLRYSARCAVCFRSLEPGTKAEWNAVRKVAICLACTHARPGSRAGGSVAGGSAHAKAGRLRSSQQARLDARRAAHPFLARLIESISPERDAGAEYDKGGEGERQLAASLEPLVAAGHISVLHDRRIPGSSANIDHLLVAASGVWVVDAKKYAGRIAKNFRGNVFTGRAVVTVGGRDRSSLIQGVHRQIAVVESALDPSLGPPVPVHGALCFVDGDWGLRFRPFTLADVLITWPKGLRARLTQDGPIDRLRRHALREQLATALPPAS